MQLYHTYRHFGQTVLAWILAFLVLCAGAAGTDTAFADDVTPDPPWDPGFTRSRSLSMASRSLPGACMCRGIGTRS